MKKKLLITLGCSCTEGVGVYDYNVNPKLLRYTEMSPEKKLQAQNIFHEEGWPNKVGKQIKANKVINLGAGGSSNSTHLKLFVDKIVPRIKELQEEYSIFLIWMMTEPARFSFYSPTGIRLNNPAEVSQQPFTLPMEKAYIETMPEMTIGPIREALFYLKMSEAMFKHYNIEAVYTSWSPAMDLFYDYYITDSYLKPEPHFLMKHSIGRANRSGVCDHPNERGYQIWADVITDALKLHHPNFLKNSVPGEFDWEWLGETVYGIEHKPWQTKTII